jgi:hypothetical protein
VDRRLPRGKFVPNVEKITEDCRKARDIGFVTCNYHQTLLYMFNEDEMGQIRKT